MSVKQLLSVGLRGLVLILSIGHALALDSPATALSARPGPRSATLSFAVSEGSGPYLAACVAPGKPQRTAAGPGSPLTVQGLVPLTEYSCSVNESSAKRLGSTTSVKVTAKADNLASLLLLLLDTDNSSPSATPPVMGDVPSQNGMVGVALSLNLAAYVTTTNGDAITGYALASGSLPPGLTLNPTSGAIGGTPTAAGSYNITVTASDKDGVSNADAVQFGISATQTAGPSSYELIDAAFNAGQITEEQALIYKLYVDFNDPALPGQYLGNDSELIADQAASLVHAYINRAGIGNIPQATLDIIGPYLVPPYYEGSWWHRNQLAAQRIRSGEKSSPKDTPVCRLWDDYCGINAAEWGSVIGTNVRVWFLKANEATDADRAIELASEIDQVIWPKLTTLMGRQPLDDSGWLKFEADGRLDVILHDNKAGQEGVTLSKSIGCEALPAYIYMDRKLSRDALFVQTAHEFMHAIQFSYDVASYCNSDYSTLKEATAVWASHYVYPNGVNNSGKHYESKYAKSYLSHPDWSYDKKGEDNSTLLFRYGAYLFPLFLEKQFNASIVKEIWESTTTQASELDAISAALEGQGKKFEDIWPKFAAANYSHAADNYALQLQNLKTYDNLTKLDADVSDAATPLGASSAIWSESVAIPHAAAEYHRFVFTKADARNLVILNGISYKASAETYPLVDGKVFYYTPLSDNERSGASVQLLFKINGAWLSDTVNMTTAPLPLVICRDDPKTRIDEIVFIYSNAEIDPAKPNYNELKERGGKSGIHFNNIGCRDWVGNISMTYDMKLGSVTETLTNIQPIVIRPQMFTPEITPSPERGEYQQPEMKVSLSGAAPYYMVSGGFRWTRSGSYTSGSKTCTQSGTLDIPTGVGFPVGSFGNMVLNGGGSDHGAQIISLVITCGTAECIDTRYTDTCSTDSGSIPSWDLMQMDLHVNLTDPAVHVSADGLSLSGTGAQSAYPPRVTGTWSFKANTQ